MSELSEELTKVLKEAGASLVGFADLSSYVEGELTVGISLVKEISPEVIATIKEGPSRMYFNNYQFLNEQLRKIARTGEAFLRGRGYQAKAHIDSQIQEFGNYRTALPQKTVATSAGLGWIGKSALLVTKEYGPAVRLSSILTNAPLPCGVPITSSLCGGCTRCTNACPGKAINGTLWNRGTDRDELIDPIACRAAARGLAAERLQEEITLCGKCIYVCPYTRMNSVGLIGTQR